MSVTVNVDEAKKDLAELIKKALAGEEVIVAEDGKPVVKIVPTSSAKAEPRIPPAGILRGRIHVPDDFNDPLPDEYLGF